jgi:hypothetical protein
MTTLLYHMGAAAVQGMWASLSRKRESGGTMLRQSNPDILKNSCWLWREEGPFFETLRKQREEEEN